MLQEFVSERGIVLVDAHFVPLLAAAAILPLIKNKPLCCSYTKTAQSGFQKKYEFGC